ncbi:hypothetical protein T07_3516 [Trichinella nelsoni]|uniref:Uncharacterized protein n=1 Tax=Trichinella nelsoni TaxID=6336 RepID=A0A0V0SL12_9BILA|nr:hypothetical protein T07_3516 [Trichinella nelsoni]
MEQKYKSKICVTTTVRNKLSEKNYANVNTITILFDKKHDLMTQTNISSDMFYEAKRARYEARNNSFTRSIGATAVLEIAAAVPPVTRSTQNLVTSNFFPSLPPLLKAPPPPGAPCPSLGTLICALPPLGVSDLLMAKPNVQMNNSVTRQKVQVAIPMFSKTKVYLMMSYKKRDMDLRKMYLNIFYKLYTICETLKTETRICQLFQ